MNDLFIRCKTCGRPITRNMKIKLDDEWVHADDVIQLSPNLRISRYDHIPTPDVIEVQGHD